jgi:glycosyltransferase involved in cell wall biosynthesis
MREDLIVVGERRDGLPSPAYQLMRRLLLDRQVLWVDADAFCRGGGPAKAGGPAARGDPMGDVTGDQAADQAGADDNAPFPILTATALGAGRHPLARFVSPAMLARRIRRAAQLYGLRQPILWLAAPGAGALARCFAADALVYQHLPMRGGRARIAEPDGGAVRAVAGDADLVLVQTPDGGCRAFGPHKTHVLPNGVDTDLFATPCQRALDIPWDRPVAGYHGRIDARFDVDLVAEAARRLTRWRFVLIGPVSRDVSALRGLDNVHLLGPRPHAELPRFSQYWSAAIMPGFRGDSPVSAASAGDAPLQLGEYMAAGLPVVVAGDWPLGVYADLVTPASDGPQLAGALAAVLEEPPVQRERRRARALGEAWSARAAFVNRLLDKLCARGRVPLDAHGVGNVAL